MSIDTATGRGHVDSHQHFWEPSRVRYNWLDGAPSLNRDFSPADLAPELEAAGVSQTVLVQSADSAADTEYMLGLADQNAFIAGVVGWVPLEQPELAAAMLDRWQRHPRFKGIRHLIHGEPDADWLIRPAVLEGLGLLAERGLSFDVVAVLPRHLEHLPVIAEKIPGLRMVIDHLAKPPIMEGGWEPWAGRIAEAAACPQVFGKVSGLNTAADPDRWDAGSLQPYVEHAIQVFGPGRLMFGSDWPVLTLAGDYSKVWAESCKLVDGLKSADRAAIMGGTAASFYRLDESGREDFG